MRSVLCFLIEDDLDDQEFFFMALSEIDKRIQCEVSNNALEALSTLRQPDRSIPEYIFLDVNMPKMNGLDCLKEIRSLAHLSNTSVYLFSTSSDKKIIERAIILGANGFIVKPSSMLALQEKLREVIKPDAA